MITTTAVALIFLNSTYPTLYFDSTAACERARAAIQQNAPRMLTLYTVCLPGAVVPLLPEGR